MRQALNLTCAAMLIFAGTGPALAQDTAPPPAKTCTAMASLPPEFVGFDSPRPQTAALTVDVAPKLSVGVAYRLGLLPAPGVTYVAALKKPAENGRFAGFAAITIIRDGLYSIAASEGVWIDILSGSDLIRSASFGRAECSTIHKVVNFALKPGTYTLQLSNAPSKAVTIMIAPKP